MLGGRQLRCVAVRVFEDHEDSVLSCYAGVSLFIEVRQREDGKLVKRDDFWMKKMNWRYSVQPREENE